MTVLDRRWVEVVFVTVRLGSPSPLWGPPCFLSLPVSGGLGAHLLVAFEMEGPSVPE